MTTPSFPLFAVHLDEEVSRDLFVGAATPTFALLHKGGSYLQQGAGPVVTSTWLEACAAADAAGCRFLVSFAKRTVLARVRYDNGNSSWTPAVVFPHSSLEQYCEDPDSPPVATSNKPTTGATRRRAARALVPVRTRKSRAR